MREIKFRGKSIHSGEIIFGGYYKNCSGEEFIVQPNGEMNRVESAFQLISRDKKGNEIYEGDLIKSLFGSSVYATFRHYAEIKDGLLTLEQTRFIDRR